MDQGAGEGFLRHILGSGRIRPAQAQGPDDPGVVGLVTLHEVGGGEDGVDRRRPCHRRPNTHPAVAAAGSTAVAGVGMGAVLAFGAVTGTAVAGGVTTPVAVPELLTPVELPEFPVLEPDEPELPTAPPELPEHAAAPLLITVQRGDGVRISRQLLGGLAVRGWADPLEVLVAVPEAVPKALVDQLVPVPAGHTTPVPQGPTMAGVTAPDELPAAG
jgi:hypothetical protein